MTWDCCKCWHVCVCASVGQKHKVPLSCPTRLAFRTFFPLATSLSVTVVHRFILQVAEVKRRDSTDMTKHVYEEISFSLSSVCVFVIVCIDWPGILGPVHHVVDVVLVSHKVDSQQAGVTVGGVESLEAVTQVLLRGQASQTAAQMLHVEGRNRHYDHTSIRQCFKVTAS